MDVHTQYLKLQSFVTCKCLGISYGSKVTQHTKNIPHIPSQLFPSAHDYSTLSSMTILNK